MSKPISYVLEFTDKLKTKEQRIECLRQNDGGALRQILRFAFGGVKWLLPEGDPPYIPNEDQNSERGLYNEARKLYLFVEGGNPNLTDSKREALFIQFLQNINTEDAKLILAMKDGKLPWKNLDATLALEAFPDLYV